MVLTPRRRDLTAWMPWEILVITPVLEPGISRFGEFYLAHIGAHSQALLLLRLFSSLLSQQLLKAGQRFEIG